MKKFPAKSKKHSAKMTAPDMGMKKPSPKARDEEGLKAKEIKKKASPAGRPVKKYEKDTSGMNAYKGIHPKKV